MSTRQFFKVGEPAASGTGKAFRSGDGFGRWSQHADQLLAVRSIARRLGWRVTRLASVPPFGRLRGRTLPRWLKHFSMAGNRRRLAALEVLPEWRTAAGISALHGEGVKEAPVRRITWSVLTAAMLVGLAGFVTQRGSTDVQLAGSFGPPWAASTVAASVITTRSSGVAGTGGEFPTANSMARRSAGVSRSSVLLGRALSSAATASSWSRVDRQVGTLGKYWRSRPLVPDAASAPSTSDARPNTTCATFSTPSSMSTAPASPGATQVECVES